MATKSTLGQYLINELLPKQHQTHEPLNKGALNKKLLAIAREDPVAYVDIVSKLKTLGDDISTYEGISVGLDDIAPEYAKRDAIMDPALAAMKQAKNYGEREKIILDTQTKMLDLTKSYPGSMGRMARSGARGDTRALMKTTASPVAASDKGLLVPWLLPHSYSEGLSSADYWVTGNEARANNISTHTAVTEPGDISKILINNMYPLVITKLDCGTHNGIALASNDGSIVGRYLARDHGGYQRNTLVTQPIANQLRTAHDTVYVRSPMTCEAQAGLCQKCQGLDEKNQPHAIGINVGVRAAAALAEPLTQVALDAKHGARLLKGSAPTLSGIKGIRQLIEVPESFFSKATLAEKAGKISSVAVAPHGGYYVHIGETEHYVPPMLKVLVHEGQTVEAGDALSDGIPKPDEIVAHKGLGAGRKYLAEVLHRVYHDSGVDLDKRHLELLARAELNHVRILDHAPEHPELIKGDVVSYDRYKQVASANTQTVPLDKAEGRLLGKEALHFTVGTPITPSMLATLHQHGVDKVEVSTTAPRVEFLMAPMMRNPLLNPDWMARLAHRFLKDSLYKGVHFGQSSDLHSVHPVPAYAFGETFGEGSEGRY